MPSGASGCVPSGAVSNSSNRAEGGRASSSGRRQAEAWQALGLASPGGDGGGSDLGGARLTKHDHAHRSGQFSSSLILRLPTLWAHYVRRHLGSSPDDTEYDAVDSLRRQRTESWNLGPVNRQTLYQTATSSDLSTAEDLIVQNVEGGSYPGWLEDSGFLCRSDFLYKKDTCHGRLHGDAPCHSGCGGLYWVIN